MHRFFISPDNVHQKQPEITGSDAIHIKRVIRLRAGDEIELFDGTGSLYKARIISLLSSNVQVQILKTVSIDTESALEIVVAQALLKDKKMDRLVRQLTELGIIGWIPFTSERTVPMPDPKRMASRKNRWETIVRESLKQCRRGKLPRVDDLKSFQDVVSLGASFDLACLFWENETHRMRDKAMDIQKPQRVLAVFGPEGGFGRQEIAAARGAGFITFGLGPRILRAETATIAGATLLQYQFGDMGSKTT